MRTLIQSALIALILIILYSCESDDEDFVIPVPEGPLVVIEIGEDYYPEDTEVVIYLSKDSGELIESVKVRNGDIIEVERPIDFTEERLSVTFFEASGNPFTAEYDRYFVRTWRGVKPGYSRSLIRNRNKLGQAVLNFNNVPVHTAYLISTPFSSTSGIGMPDRRTATIYGPDDCKGLVRLDMADGPAYKIIEQMNTGANIMCDFDQIEMQTDFTHNVINIPPDNYGNIELQLNFFARENNFESYRYRVEEIQDSSPPTNLGQVAYTYPKSFINNTTFNLDIALTNKLGETFTMDVTGNTLPSNFDVLRSDIQFISVSGSEFEVKVNATDSFDSMSSFWFLFENGQNPKIITYFVWSAPDDNAYALPEMPDVIKNEFPDFDITNLRLSAVSITDNSLISTYDELIESWSTVNQPHTTLGKSWSP